MKWLVTGGCGFIGRSLVARIRSTGTDPIRIVDNLSASDRSDLADVAPFRESSLPLAATRFPECGVELVVADILDQHAAIDLARDADVIVHLAANTGVGPSVDNPRHDCIANVVGTLNYLEAARLGGVRRFVFASSGAPVGECRPPIHEDLPARPVSPYGASKLAGEGYCSAYYRSFGIETAALRFGNVYGPRSSRKASVVAQFIRQALDGETLEIYGDGRQTRDFVYVDDLVVAVQRAATTPNIGGEIFQIASNRETTVNELVAALEPLLHDIIGTSPAIAYAEPRTGDVLRNFSDTQKARRQLGWQPQIELSEGLRRTVAWFAAQRAQRSCPEERACA